MKKRVRELQPMDKLTGSGFVVVKSMYSCVINHRVINFIDGYYPRSPIKSYRWNPDTTVNTIDPKGELSDVRN